MLLALLATNCLLARAWLTGYAQHDVWNVAVSSDGRQYGWGNGPWGLMDNSVRTNWHQGKHDTGNWVMFEMPATLSGAPYSIHSIEVRLPGNAPNYAYRKLVVFARAGNGPLEPGKYLGNDQ